MLPCAMQVAVDERGGQSGKKAQKKTPKKIVFAFSPLTGGCSEGLGRCVQIFR